MLHTFLISAMPVTCPIHLMVFDLITLTEHEKLKDAELISNKRFRNLICYYFNQEYNFNFLKVKNGKVALVL
jgi:hypothetical protein